jgi:hypothetical protein
MSKIHEVVKGPIGAEHIYHCLYGIEEGGAQDYACLWMGVLEDAIGHTIKNQFKVEYDPRNAKLGSASDADKYPRKLSNIRNKRQRKYNLVPRDY